MKKVEIYERGSCSLIMSYKKEEGGGWGLFVNGVFEKNVTTMDLYRAIYDSEFKVRYFTVIEN